MISRVSSKAGAVKAKSRPVDRSLIHTGRSLNSSRSNNSVSSARLREEVKSLTKALDETNEEISRQQLKIGLNTKTKGYEKKPARLL